MGGRPTNLFIALFHRDLMDLPWGDKRSEQFVTNVGLITSDGPYGPNVMAAEWTFHVSYSPGLIAVLIGQEKATYENIRASGEFGVNIASVDQSVIASVSGRYSGKEIDKIGLLRELGFSFHSANKIKAPMVVGASMNAECLLSNEIALGDHPMFLGKVIEASSSDSEPLAYHKGRYWMMNQNLEKPSEEKRRRIKSMAEKYLKNE